MVLLLRTHRESVSVMRLTRLLLLGAGGSLIFNDDVQTALGCGLASIHTIGFLAGPSRSWASDFNRVAVWSLDNMYTENQCWRAMRFRKSDLPLLKRALRLPDMLQVHSPGQQRRGRHLVFSGMEALVVFLTRLSSSATWEEHIEFLGGRSRTTYTEVFFWVLDHIYTNYAHCITDITRWSDWAAVFAQAVTDAGAEVGQPLAQLASLMEPSVSCVGHLGTSAKRTRATVASTASNFKQWSPPMV